MTTRDPIDERSAEALCRARGLVVYGAFVVAIGNVLALFAWLQGGLTITSDESLFQIMLVRFIIPVSFTGPGLTMLVFGLAGILEHRKT